MEGMRLRHISTPLPRDWTKIKGVEGLILDADLRIDSGRLRAKLLVFKNRPCLRKFWVNHLGKGNLGARCCGAVNSLIQEVRTIPGKKDKFKETAYLEADPRYYCVMGLARGWLTIEIICHESVHAAFCYTKRVKRVPWAEHLEDFHEEELCYPTGRIANKIVEALRKAALVSDS